MRRFTINVLVMFLTMALGTVVSLVRSGSIPAPIVDRETEEYAVYSGLMNSFQPQPGADLLLVARQTIPTVPQDSEVDDKEFVNTTYPMVQQRKHSTTTSWAIARP
ncbi:MAG TPA: hypothetical protein VI750_12745 [Pyrinomonadaceae bacterium]|nr:hypothetical protein [Pyrinomonadaceae bacterium]